jgi:hypothetical protein
MQGVIQLQTQHTKATSDEQRTLVSLLHLLFIVQQLPFKQLNQYGRMTITKPETVEMFYFDCNTSLDLSQFSVESKQFVGLYHRTHIGHHNAVFSWLTAAVS